MLKILKTRIKQGHQTVLPERFRGLPQIHPERCVAGCKQCGGACATKAVSLNPLTLDLGRCLFCQECVSACPHKAIEYSNDIKMAVRKRGDLLLKGQELKLATVLDKKMRSLLGRSLKLRVVTAGSCNGCEMELNAVNNIQFDLSRFGIQVVASPRHADGIIVTGPVTNNMKLALEKTFAAVPEPKIVIAVGACAINGGPFENSSDVNNGADKILPVDLYIPGCPPHPLTIIDGLLRLISSE